MASTRTTTERAAAPPDAPAPDDAAPQLLTFVVGGRRYGCRLEAVREILVARPATRLPGAPAHVLGLLNVRGALLTVLDVGRWLEEQGASRVVGGTRNQTESAEAAELGIDSPSSAASATPSASSAFLPAKEDAGSPTGHVLVVETEGRLGGCRVEGLGRAMAMPALDRPPSGNAAAGGIVLGIGEADGELVAVLDLPRLVRQSLLFPGER